MRRLITDMKILDLKANELVKPPFFYGDAITDDIVTVIAEECYWLREVDGRQMFLPMMVRGYSAFDFQYLWIACVMEEKISKYQDGVIFRRIDHQGGRSTETNTQAVRLYPDKYGPRY